MTDDIRAACRAVSCEAEFIRIDTGAIPAYAHSLPLHRIQMPEIDEKRHHIGHGAETVAFFLTLDAVNFGSGYFPHLKKLPNCSGYYTIASMLTERFQRQGPFSAQELLSLHPKDCARIFGQDPENEPVMALMNLFAKALNDLGHYLIDRFNGDFMALVDAAEHSAEKLTEILAQMPLYRDISDFKGRKVPFFKRAQLTAADLHIAFSGIGSGRFHDLDRLTIFADNLVPHVLKMDGILRYDPELDTRINAGELIPAGSEEEVEIRACAIHAAEQIKEALNRNGHGITAMQLDYLLWSRGGNPDYKAHPRHRTRTCFY